MTNYLERKEIASFTLNEEKDLLIIENVLNISKYVNLDKRELGVLINHLCEIKSAMNENLIPESEGEFMRRSSPPTQG